MHTHQQAVVSKSAQQPHPLAHTSISHNLLLPSLQDPNIGPNIPGMMEVVLGAFASTDNPDLRDYSHSMFGNVAKALGEAFGPWLQRTVPLAFASCEQEDGAFGSEGESDGEQADADGDGEDSSSEDEDGRGHFNVRTGELRLARDCGWLALPGTGCVGPLKWKMRWHATAAQLKELSRQLRTTCLRNMLLQSATVVTLSLNPPAPLAPAPVPCRCNG